MFIFMGILDKTILLRKLCPHLIFWLWWNGNPCSGLMCAGECVTLSGWDGFAHLLFIVSCSNWLIQASYVQIVRRETTTVRQLKG